jgi:hypothetical protein
MPIGPGLAAIAAGRNATTNPDRSRRLVRRGVATPIGAKKMLIPIGTSGSKFAPNVRQGRVGNCAKAALERKQDKDGIGGDPF